jgi:hypothetical protein
MLASFLGVLPILTPPLCALAFIMCSKFNRIVVFALDLMSTYEGEHMKKSNSCIKSMPKQPGSMNRSLTVTCREFEATA